MDSILESIKKMLGITSSYTVFDNDLIIHINSVFFILNQLGVGPKKPFSISGSSAVWSDFLGDNTDVEGVKTYVYLKVKLLFDPPSTSSAVEAMNRLALEYEWRLNVQVDQELTES